MRFLGRSLQLVALIVLPLAMYLQVAGAIPGPGRMLSLAAAGACVFWIGRILEGYAKEPKPPE